MGMFDGILGGVFGAGATALLNSFIEQQGGLQNIARQFEKNGFGDTMKAWISQGRNLPITAEQIEQGRGYERGKSLAGGRGLPADKPAELLAQQLPQAIDKVTPDGKIPS